MLAKAGLPEHTQRMISKVVPLNAITDFEPIARDFCELLILQDNLDIRQQFRIRRSKMEWLSG